MGEFEDVLGDMGLKQWVRNKFVAKLRDFQQEGSKDVDKFVAEFNVEIFQDFKKIATEEIDETIKKAATLLEEAKDAG